MITVVATLNGVEHQLHTVEITHVKQSNEVVFKSRSKHPGLDSVGNEIPMDVHLTWHLNGTGHLAVNAKESKDSKTKRSYFLERTGSSPSHFVGESDGVIFTHMVNDIVQSPPFIQSKDTIELVSINLDKIQGRSISVGLTLME